MADLRAQDIGIIIVSLVVVVCVRATYAYRAEISMIIAALWRRYVAVGDWRAAMDRLADERQRVSRYDDRTEREGGDVMSPEAGSTPRRPGSSTGSADPVSGQQNQQAPELVLDFDTIIDYLARHKLDTPERVVDVLAVLQFGEGHVLSANKIRDIAGGNEAAVKARVASRRPKADAPKPAKRLERPVEGW